MTDSERVAAQPPAGNPTPVDAGEKRRRNMETIRGSHTSGGVS